MSVDPLAAYSIQQLLGYAAPALLLAVKDMMDDVFMALDGYQPTHLTQFILILSRCSTVFYWLAIHPAHGDVCSTIHALARWQREDALPNDYHHYNHHGLRSVQARPKLKTDVTNDDNPDPPPHITLVLEVRARSELPEYSQATQA